MAEKTNIVIVSDLHINSKVALCTPTVNLDDNDTHHASPAQHWLWECWLDFWRQVGKLENRTIAILNGDLGELDTLRRSNQLISPNKAVILSLVLDVLKPMLDVIDSVIVIRGTAAHEGKSSWLEEAIAQDLTNAIPASKTIASWWHFQGMIGDLRIDAAHHASMGSIPANAASKLAQRAIAYYITTLRLPEPHYVFRSHNHKYADSGGNYSTKAIFTPCWSLMTEYGYRTGHELELADIGGVIIEDGKDRLIRYSPKDTRKVWSLKI